MAFEGASQPTSRLFPLPLCHLQVRNSQQQGMVDEGQRKPHCRHSSVLVDTLRPDSSPFSGASVGLILSCVQDQGLHPRGAVKDRNRVGVGRAGGPGAQGTRSQVSAFGTTGARTTVTEQTRRSEEGVPGSGYAHERFRVKKP